MLIKDLVMLRLLFYVYLVWFLSYDNLTPLHSFDGDDVLLAGET